MTLRVGSIAVGASDVQRAVSFGRRAPDHRPREEPDDTRAVPTPVSGDGPIISIAPSGTPTQDRPRVHLDLQAADVVVLADPEGNRFCVIDKGGDL